MRDLKGYPLSEKHAQSNKREPMWIRATSALSHLSLRFKVIREFFAKNHENC